ncbi:DUF2333 family protein [Rhizobium leguminosarum]|jgi:hypothetical protein|uniref:Membrane protein n=2 Tax=Rhizobium leguminosarum TaxID=384 RepID=A0A1B8RFR8_RHILT|nr:DUF2333 family protein [Rhizobium leguminosarum]MDH6657558.1 hypothetical protein [Rhizobium sophorae]AOO89341.1 membrane protein [Rhizobium leguminosarum bv. trifolii]MBB4521121.1 hypothetical protein [Rhizobium leguminosarum]MBP2488621.1 hypothetical protein [Rhizobium leguminosarum]MBY5463716.1 DUF2333 family protein [Rhizobium leguminosarum]
MLDRIAGFFRLIGQMIGRWARLFSAWAFWPFLAAHGWYQRRSWMIRLPVIAFVALLVALYGYFFWETQVWSNFNTAFVDQYRLSERKVAAGQEVPVAEGANTTAPKTCQRSAIVDVAADLTDFNVNQNAWISSMVLYKMGFFGIDWDHTPFLDNKASFQRGVNQAVRRTSVELVDTLGRVRGTSGINNDLQNARGNLQFDEYSWYFGLNPFGPKTPTPSYYRSAIGSLRKFNTDLALCNAIFDGRADNLVQFIDRIANDLGGTSDMLAERSENHNRGWFDTRADDRFWFAYGQLYGYYAIMAAAQADFSQVVAERNLGAIWGGTMRQFQSALRIQPAIISNGREDGWIMPSHLATMGFYILRVRSNLVEIRSVLDR